MKRRKTETIVFGGGCFWCTEAVFSMFDGVIHTTPGYAGGVKEDPTYEEVCGGATGHAEVLKVEYDPGVATLEKLLDIFFSMHDPTSLNRQEADVGSQYRSIILFTSKAQEEAVERFISKMQKNYDRSIVTEVGRLGKFYPSEDYHKDYYKANPLQPYCMLVIGPKVQKIKKRYGI